MKIAILCRRYYPQIGGIETHVKEISERLSNSHEVIVYTLVKDGQLVGDEMINGVRVKRFKSLGLDYSAEVPPRSLLREVKKFDPDIIHSHSAHTSLPYFASKIKCSRAKFIVSPHYQGKATNAFRQTLFVLYKPLLGSALSKADRIVCVSSAERDMLSSIFRIDQQKVRIVQNGVGSDLINITSPRNMQDNGELRILSVARFDLQHKKTDKLITAFKLLESKIYAKLVLVGNGPDRQEIINLVKSLDLDDKVEIKTNLSREALVREYAQASVFVTASEKEAFGIAVAEALAAKLKVIVPNATALSSYVKAGYALGVEVPITPEKLAEAVLSAIQNDRTRSTTVEYPPYTWDIAARDQEAVYEELLREDQEKK